MSETEMVLQANFALPQTFFLIFLWTLQAKA